MSRSLRRAGVLMVRVRLRAIDSRWRLFPAAMASRPSAMVAGTTLAAMLVAFPDTGVVVAVQAPVGRLELIRSIAGALSDEMHA